MKLVDDWRAALHHYSTKALAVAGGLQGMWALLDETTKSNLPPSVGQAIAWITFTVAMSGLAGKFVDQTPRAKPSDPA